MHQKIEIMYKIILIIIRCRDSPWQLAVDPYPPLQSHTPCVVVPQVPWLEQEISSVHIHSVFKINISCFVLLIMAMKIVLIVKLTGAIRFQIIIRFTITHSISCPSTGSLIFAMVVVHAHKFCHWIDRKEMTLVVLFIYQTSIKLFKNTETMYSTFLLCNTKSKISFFL